MEGEWNDWFGDGQRRARTTYHDGRPNLVDRTYWPSGELRHEWTYREGILHGPYRDYREDGSESVLGQFEGGVRDGEWLYFRPDGSVDPDRSGTYAGDLRTRPWQPR
jgi:antitoxin component YwqK of YwqJK toxin-antitoxin module